MKMTNTRTFNGVEINLDLCKNHCLRSPFKALVDNEYDEWRKFIKAIWLNPDTAEQTLKDVIRELVRDEYYAEDLIEDCLN